MTSLLDRGAGRPWMKIRAKVLARDRHQCVLCGATEGLQVDHIVERWAGGGDDLANLQTLCSAHHKAKSAASSATMRRMRSQQSVATKSPSVSMDSLATPRSPAANFPRQVASHGGLTGLEPSGTPRYWPEPHPDAVGSRGGELTDYARRALGVDFLPWQAALSDLVLQYGPDGLWCRSTWVLVVGRQAGKSVWLRALASWLARQGLVVLTCSAKLQSTAHLMRPELLKHRSDPDCRVTFAKEQPEIGYPGWTEDSHRWIGQAGNSGFGRSFTADLVLIDEAQDVPTEALEAVSPTLTERPNPLTIICGTGTRADSEPLLAEQRALAVSGGPAALVEWSAPPGSDWTDEEVWRQASPRWTPARLRHLRKEVSKGEAYIRTEYLCQQVNAPGTEPWLDLAAWARARQPLDIPDAVQVAAVEDGRGGTGGAVALAWSQQGAVHVVGLLTESLDEAWAYSLRAERVLCGITLRDEPSARSVNAKPVGRRETATALPELRRLLSVNGLAWDGDDLDDQIRTVTVREDSTGSLMVAPNAPSGVMRAAAWAVQSVRISREPVLV